MGKKDMHDFDVEYVHNTDKGLCVSDDGGETEIWLPISQITWQDGERIDPGDLDGYEKREIIDISVPEWLAEDKGLL
jgi:hypothetical protein